MSSHGAYGFFVDPGDAPHYASARLWRVAAFRGDAETPGSLAWRLWQCAPRGCLNFFLDDTGLTPLLAACVVGSTSLCSALLRWGAHPDFADNAGWSPLHWCSLSGQLECIRALLDAGADARVGLGRMETPLHFCASSSNWACADLIHRAGGLFDDIDPGTHGSAALFGSHEPDALFKIGCRALPAADALGRTALHWAIMRAHDDNQAARACIAWLAHGADPQALDARGVSPLCLCTEQGWTQTRWVLLSALERAALSQDIRHTFESGIVRL